MQTVSDSEVTVESVERTVGDSRKMVSAELGGSHSHDVGNGQQVHIYRRSGKYLARGRYQRQIFGVNLGSHEGEALIELRGILVAIYQGTFERPTEARQAVVAPQVPLHLSYRDLTDRYLTDVRRRSGEDSMKTIRSRLDHFLAFAEQDAICRLAPLPSRVSTSLAQKFVDYLRTQEISRNGKPGAEKHPMSLKHQQNCYAAVRTMFDWGRKPAQGLLPASLINPFVPELIGSCPPKDPLRDNPIPLQKRIALVEQMEPWQLKNLSFQLVLPLRPYEMCAALVDDLDMEGHWWKIGYQLPEWYITKGGTCYRLPLPPILTQLGRILVENQGEGPLFRRPLSPRRPVRTLPCSGSDKFQERFAQHLTTKSKGKSLTQQDRKQLYLQELIALGGLSPEDLRDHWKDLFQKVGLPQKVRAYDLRAAVTTEMSSSGIRNLELRYLTSHTTNDILNEYVTLSPQEEMQKYFERIQPLLTAIEQRVRGFGLIGAGDLPANLPSSAKVSSGAAANSSDEEKGSCRETDGIVEFKRCG